MISVIVGQPSYDGRIRIEQTSFFIEAAACAEEKDWLFDAIQALHMPIEVARNWLVKQAFSRKADILFMLDDDAVPAIGTFQAFVEHMSAYGEPIAA